MAYGTSLRPQSSLLAVRLSPEFSSLAVNVAVPTRCGNWLNHACLRHNYCCLRSRRLAVKSETHWISDLRNTCTCTAGVGMQSLGKRTPLGIINESLRVSFRVVPTQLCTLGGFHCDLTQRRQCMCMHAVVAAAFGSDRCGIAVGHQQSSHSPGCAAAQTQAAAGC
jgi:hypothetical protein